MRMEVVERPCWGRGFWCRYGFQRQPHIVDDRARWFASDLVLAVTVALHSSSSSCSSRLCPRSSGPAIACRHALILMPCLLVSIVSLASAYLLFVIIRISSLLLVLCLLIRLSPLVGDGQGRFGTAGVYVCTLYYMILCLRSAHKTLALPAASMTMY